MFKSAVFFVISFLFLCQCYSKKIDIQLPDESLKNIKGIVFLPIKSNFKIKEKHIYQILLESADYVALSSNYFVLLPRDYKMSEHCPFGEIFICSGLKDLLSEAGIRPSDVLFVEYTVAEETEVISTELSEVAKKTSKNIGLSDIKYKVITKLLHYSANKEVFEDRFYLKPDVSTDNAFSLISKYIKGLLSNIIIALDRYTGFVSQKAEIKYYINPFQFFYNSAVGEGKICIVDRLETDKEIEAQLFFEEIYGDRCKNCISVMKNFSCGILYEGQSFPFVESNIINVGDFIVSFCGREVFGLYSIKNAIRSGNCLRDKRVIVIRNSSKIELSL